MSVLVEADPLAAESLRAVIPGQVHVLSSFNELRQVVDDDAGLDLVVFGASVDVDLVLDFAARQRVSRPALGVVLVRSRVDSNLLRAAMRAGVREVVKPDELTALAEACLRSQELSRGVGGGVAAADTAAPARRGQLVSVFASKGGAGKTTLATNLSVVLAAKGRRRVCLVDLDLAFGDVAIAMQLFPSRTIGDALSLSRLDSTAVQSLTTEHSPGLDVIAAPVDPGTHESISAALIGDLLDLLTASYDFVVVDTPPAFTEQVLAAFDRTDHFVLPATLDVPSIKNLKLTLETLDLLSYPRERRHVALNRSDAKVGLSIADVEKTLQTRIELHIPSHRAVPASMNRGVPIALDEPGHAVSRVIRTFAETTLVPRTTTPPSHARTRRISLRRRPHTEVTT